MKKFKIWAQTAFFVAALRLGFLA
eukprot:SAG11_NODE_18719_length_483_cov_0.916667_1_plen_23_part_10